MIKLLGFLISASAVVLTLYLYLKFEEKEQEKQKELAELEIRDKKIKRDILLLELLLKRNRR